MAVNSKLQNEEEIPSYLPDEPATTKPTGGSQGVEEGVLEAREGDPVVEILDEENAQDGSQPVAQ